MRALLALWRIAIAAVLLCAGMDAQVSARTSLTFAIPPPIVSGGQSQQPAPQKPSIVPNLIGRTEQEARAMLERARLKVGQITTGENPATPGTVFKQDRSPGATVAPGTPVSFVLATPVLVEVPNLIGRTEQEARALIDNAKLRVGQIATGDANARAGTVFKQDRAPGSRVAPGTRVSFAVAVPVTVPVPNLIGRTEQEARALIERARLSVGQITTSEANATPGTVFKQDRPPDSRVAPGTPISFALAASVSVPVPNLIGRTEQEARTLLEKARLNVGQVTTSDANATPGTVFKQDRPPDSRVAPGTRVGFAVAVSVSVPVPNLVGRTEQEARALIEKARLNVGQVTTSEANATPGTVFKQDRSPGSTVAPGTPIGFAVAVSVSVQVPNLIGRTEQEARQLIDQMKLSVGQVTTSEANATPGTVFKQDRSPGSTVAPGTPISFALASPILVQVPNLVGRTEQEARALIERARLSVGPVTTSEANAKPGTVFKQDRPADSTVSPGTPVGFVLATPILIEVPSLVGRQAQEASDLLTKLGLQMRVDRRRPAREPVGQVLAQAMAPGQRVPVGSAVGLEVASIWMVEVPRLVDKTQVEATDLIGKAELVVGVVTTEESRRPEGTVLSQRPPAGQSVAVGTSMNVVVAKPLTVDVPSVVGRAQGEVADLLKKAELALGDVNTDESRRPAGTVISQQPVGGQRVPIGTRIAIVVARPVTVLVPDLSSRSVDAARQSLTAIDLVTGRITSEESRGPAGLVIRQSVGAGARVPIGTTVDLVTATPVTVLVPKLIGLAEDKAREQLAGAELATGTVEYLESTQQAGVVLTQSVDSDSRVAIATVVNFVVAAAETVPVPSVVGMTIDEARRRLLTDRLAVGSEQTRPTRLERQGTVLAQSVDVGSRVAVGTAIVLTVATPEIVTIPSVVGLTHNEAAAAMTAAGLTVGAVVARVSLQPGGTVLSQAQAAGTQVQFGTPVPLDEARPRIVWMPPVGALVLAAIAGLVRALKAKDGQSGPPKDHRPPPPVHIEARAHLDAGTGQALMTSPPAVRLEIRVRPVVDPGSQEVSSAASDLIQNERRVRQADTSLGEDGL